MQVCGNRFLRTMCLASVPLKSDNTPLSYIMYISMSHGSTVAIQGYYAYCPDCHHPLLHPSAPLTCISKHFVRCSFVSPSFPWVSSTTLLASWKNGATHTFAIPIKRSSKIQVNRGPVISIAGSELNSKMLTRNLLDEFSGLVSGRWDTRKSTP